jgi:acyl-homoserine lactone acylase PvdQ
VFQAWFLQLAPALAGDELAEDVLKPYQKRFSNVTRFVIDTLAHDVQRWCDDVRTADSESCDVTVTKALRDGLARLSAQLGPNLSRWRWDAIHVAAFPHQGLDTVTDFIGCSVARAERRLQHGHRGAEHGSRVTQTDIPAIGRSSTCHRRTTAAS